MKIFTRYLAYTILLCTLFSSQMSLAQSIITGSITEAGTNEPLIGVTVIVKGKVVGTTSDMQGKFTLSYSENPPFTLIFSSVGYTPQEVEVVDANQKIDIVLSEQVILGQEVVISASRVEESILQSPVSIEKMDILAVRETPSVNFFDGLANMKAVDMTTSSLGFKVVNTRGFNDPSNTRFVQLVDGIDNAPPSLNFPVGNLVGLSELDVESVELIPGAASALYGNAAFNGVLLMNSKSPFLYQGLSAQTKVGINHIDGQDTDPSPYYDAALRYAKAFNDKFAFKVNLAYTRGEDWHASSLEDKNGSGGGREQPGYDGLNVYGDEVATGLPIGPGGSSVLISRTGYEEATLANYDVENFKVDASLHYRISNNLEASYTFKYGMGTTVYTAFQRYSFNDLSMSQQKLELKGSNFFLRGYMSSENSNDTYDAGFTGININRAWKSDGEWFQDYAFAYAGGAPNVTPGDHGAARSFADQGRLLPGTPEFQETFNEITSIANFGTGSKFDVRSNMYHAEGMYNFEDRISFAEIQVGGSYRLYDLNSQGTLFPDTVITNTGNTNDITFYEFGGYIQATKKLFDDKLKLIASGRVDKSEQIEKLRFTPRFSAVFTQKQHNIRASFQTGFRMPTSQAQFINLDLGRIRLLGGLPQIYDSYNINAQNYTVSSAGAFGAAVQAEAIAGKDIGQAVADNLGILEGYEFGNIQPEGLKSFELGYKGLFNEKLLIDVSGYYSIYDNFLAARQVLVTANDPTVDPLAAANDISAGNYKVYGIYDNAAEEVVSYGIAAGVNYSFRKGYSLNANYTFATLDLGDTDDDLIAAFNTPEHKVNLSFGNREVVKNVGFNITWRWSDGYDWESSFSEGPVPSYNTVDAQISFKLESMKSILKIGGSNILNQRYFQIYGGPTVGALYYIGLTFDQFMN